MKRKVFIETSVFIRFLTQDDLDKFAHCVRLFELISEGKIIPYSSNVVIMEIIFILARHYSFPKKQVLDVIESLLRLRNLTLIEKTNTQIAIKLFSKHMIKYGDCLIASQVPAKMTLLTYDADFTKLPSLSVSTPSSQL